MIFSVQSVGGDADYSVVIVAEVLRSRCIFDNNPKVPVRGCGDNRVFARTVL